MQRERLQLALERLRPEQWKLFEEFASAFLSAQYPNLRTVASQSGDQGRDAELFSYDSRIQTDLQYSVSQDWKSKIRRTAKRISEIRPETRILIYVTNQSIRSSADPIKNEILEVYGLVLDIHDADWFLDRFSRDEHRESVSEDLATKIVDPYLVSRRVLQHSAPILTTTEYQAALTFLQLQWEDDTREKGLTKLSFQALVRAVLRNTNSDSRMSRDEIHNQIIALFPNHDSAHIRDIVDSALRKLTKRYIRHWIKEDEFCLTHEESIRVRGRLAAIDISNSAIDSEIRIVLEPYGRKSEEIEQLGHLIRSAVDHYLFGRGEAFANAVTNDRLDKFGIEGFRNSVERVVNSELTDCDQQYKTETINVMLSAIASLFTEPSVDVQHHLRSKSDAYTLLAFLGQTPDVQSAVSKMFSHGTIWLDTTIVLPLIAEVLLPTGRQRFTQMLKSATSSGLDLRTTPGVIEEVERHINRCLTYARMHHSQWSGGIPFLADAYMRSGRDPNSFASWIEQFEGMERPEDDLAEYFKEFFNIERESLEEEVDNTKYEIRMAVQEAWHTAHSKRRDVYNGGLDENTIHRLVRHDVENYLGVVERRRRDGVSSFGYSDWWLTLDRSANQVDRDVRERLENDAPSTPVMSADFLVNYLSIGPTRYRITKDVESTLPIALDVGSFAELPADLLSEAERIRKEAGDLPEHIIRRRVRDCLDKAKRRPGRIVEEGVRTVLDTIGTVYN